MENQHRKITGYRELNQDEIDLMNEIKAKAAEIDELVTKVEARIAEQTTSAGGHSEAANHLMKAEPMRWAAISRTQFQQGLMALTRAVAQPEFF